jgi:dTDP-D-glucose 4,6-dehydratase
VIEHGAATEGPRSRYSLNDSLLRSSGYSPRVPFGDGLKATIERQAADRTWSVKIVCVGGGPAEPGRLTV